MKTKVLIVISNMEFGGAQRQIIELINNIDQSKFEVHLCSLSEYIPLIENLNKKVSVHIIHKKYKFDFSVAFKLAKLIRQYRFHIIHSYLFDAEIAARLAAKLSLTKIIVIGSERNSDYKMKPIQIKAYKLTKGLVTSIIANSQSGANFNSKQTGQPNSKYHVVYNGVDTKRFTLKNKIESRKGLNINPESKLIGMFASFKVQKNHLFLIRALQDLRAIGLNFKLLLVGEELHGGLHGSDDYAKELKDTIKKSNFNNDVIFLGNRTDVENIYPACDITVLPSLFEGTPNVVLESMSCGIPCIATNVADNNKIIEHNKSGYIIELGDIESLKRYLHDLLNNQKKLNEFSENARSTMIKEFSSIKLAENTCNIYHNTVSKE